MYIRVFLFNVNYLQAHQECLQKEQDVTYTHIKWVTETLLTVTDQTPEYSSHNSFRLDDDLGKQRSGWITTYIHLPILKQQVFEGIEHQFLTVSTKLDCHVISYVLHYITTPGQLWNPSWHSWVTFYWNFSRAYLPYYVETSTSVLWNRHLRLIEFNSWCTIMASNSISSLQLKSRGCLNHIQLNLEAGDTVTNTISAFYSDHLVVQGAMHISVFLHWKAIFDYLELEGWANASVHMLSLEIKQRWEMLIVLGWVTLE